LPINVTSNGTLIAAPIENLNATANETVNPAELNETTPAQNVTIPAQNVTLPALNETNENVSGETKTVPVLNETNETVTVGTEVVPAKNEIVPVLNETNETIPVENGFIPTQNVTIPVQNGTAPANNLTVPENTIFKAETVNNASTTATVSEPEVTQVGSASNSVFVIGGGLKSDEAVQIGGNGQSQAFIVGSTATSVKDLSKTAFYTNVI
jgi:hypothetical protein